MYRCCRIAIRLTIVIISVANAYGAQKDHVIDRLIKILDPRIKDATQLNILIKLSSNDIIVNSKLTSSYSKKALNLSIFI